VASDRVTHASLHEAVQASPSGDRIGESIRPGVVGARAIPHVLHTKQVEFPAAAASQARVPVVYTVSDSVKSVYEKGEAALTCIGSRGKH
jgi:hypothetical protein